jgi:hypothetical protein
MPDATRERKLGIRLCVTAIIVCLLPALASGQDHCGSFGRLANAFRLLQAVYPEWKTSDVDVAFSAYSGPSYIDTRAFFW